MLNKKEIFCSPSATLSLCLSTECSSCTWSVSASLPPSSWWKCKTQSYFRETWICHPNRYRQTKRTYLCVCFLVCENLTPINFAPSQDDSCYSLVSAISHFGSTEAGIGSSDTDILISDMLLIHKYSFLHTAFVLTCTICSSISYFYFLHKTTNTFDQQVLY